MSEDRISNRTAHVKLTDRQWANLDKAEARERARRDRRNDPTPMDGWKVLKIRQLVAMGLAYERRLRRERRAALKNPGVVT